MARISHSQVDLDTFVVRVCVIALSLWEAYKNGRKLDKLEFFRCHLIFYFSLLAGCGQVTGGQWVY